MFAAGPDQRLPRSEPFPVNELQYVTSAGIGEKGYRASGITVAFDERSKVVGRSGESAVCAIGSIDARNGNVQLIK
jgi:hypothetical protein